MKELVETIAAAVLACWGKTAALAHSLGAAPAEFWKLLSVLPLLLLGMIQARGSSSGDELRATESQDRDPDLPAPSASTLPPPLVEHLADPATPESLAGAAGSENTTATPPPSPVPPAALNFPPEMPGSHPTVDEQKEFELRHEMLSCVGPINLKDVAKRLGASHAEVWDFIEGRPQLREIIDSGRQGMANLADNVLLHEFRAGKVWAGRFYYDTKGAQPVIHEINQCTHLAPRDVNARTERGPHQGTSGMGKRRNSY